MRRRIKKEGRGLTVPSLTNNRFTGESSTTPQRYEYYVPIDYVRAELIEIDTQKLRNNLHLDFIPNYVTKDGEEIQPRSRTGQSKSKKETARYKNLVIAYHLKSGRVTLSGSLHTLSNDGRHNYNDLTPEAFRAALKELYSVFGISADNMKINCIEWGVNLSPEISTDTILKHCIEHRRKPIETGIENKTANYKQARHTDYILKLYNKGKQFRVGNVFRIEHRQNNYRVYAQKQGIGRTLRNLIDSGFAGMAETLLNDWKDVIFFDPGITEQSKYFKCRDRLFWDQLKGFSRKTYCQYINGLNTANQVEGKNLKNKVAELIESKLMELNRARFATWLRFPTLGISVNRYPCTPTLHNLTYKNCPILTLHF